MRHLWAPWRMGYVTTATGQSKGCIFCDKPAANDDESNQILYRGDSVFIMMNAFPYNSGHLLVAPYRHISDPLEMTPQESSELLYGVRVGMTALNGALRPEGYNIGVNIGKVSGAGYADHLHLHLVPRWAGDTNFMAVAAETRVVPETLHDTYRRLKKAMDQQQNASGG
ncbi:MAG: HIT domain-containing protein [Armatimonadota bacterium]